MRTHESVSVCMCVCVCVSAYGDESISVFV